MLPAATPGRRPATAPQQTEPVARYVGQRIRARRTELGVSLQELSAAVGIGAEELGKCEIGLDNLPVTCVGTLASALAISTQWLFEGAVHTLGELPKETTRHSRFDWLVSSESTPAPHCELTKMAQALASKAAARDLSSRDREPRVIPVSSMPRDQALTPADSAELAASISLALNSNFGRRSSKADSAMATAVAKRLVEHLQQSGFVLMRRPADPTT